MDVASTDSAAIVRNDAEPRQRILKACASCSSRKTKCDGREGGCSSCAKLGLECVYVNSGKKRGPPKGSPARGGPPRKKRPASSQQPQPPPQSSPSSTGVASGVHPPFYDVDTKQWHSTAGPSSSSSSPLSYSLPRHPYQHPHPHYHYQQAPPPQQQPPPPQQPIGGQSSFARQMHFSRSAIDELLDIYETFIHPHWPIVYLPALGSLRVLEQRSPLLFDAILTLSAVNSSDEDMMRRCESTMVEHLRRRILDCLATEPSNLLMNRIEVIQAMILISLVDLGGGRSSMAYQFGGMACRMALDMNLHMQSPSFTSSSSTSSRRNQKRATTFESGNAQESNSSIQEARRTMWSCYVLDKILSAVLQRPPALRQQDMDVDKPSTMERDEVDLLWRAEGVARVRFLHPQAYGAMEHLRSHALSSFSAWCDVMAILERILDDVYRPRGRRSKAQQRRSSHHRRRQQHHRKRQPSRGGGAELEEEGEGEKEEDEATVVSRLDDELRRWRHSLADHLQWAEEATFEEHVDVGLQLLTLRGWYYTCVLLLHRPGLPRSLDESCSDLDAIDALQQLRGAPPRRGSHEKDRLLHPSHPFRSSGQQEPPPSHRAATAICVIMEAYEATFKVRKFPASWVYLIFQAATVHAGLAAAGDPRNTSSHEARHRLQQCITWLEYISHTWRSASHHVETLNRLLAVGARTRTRPSSPLPSVNENSLVAAPHAASMVAPPTTTTAQTGNPSYGHVIDPMLGSAAVSTPDLSSNHHVTDAATSWNLFWSSMPTTSEDVNLWQGFSDLFPMQQQTPTLPQQTMPVPQSHTLPQYGPTSYHPSYSHQQPRQTQPQTQQHQQQQQQHLQIVS